MTTNSHYTFLNTSFEPSDSTSLMIFFYRPLGLPTTDTFNLITKITKASQFSSNKRIHQNFVTRVSQEFLSSRQSDFPYNDRILNGPLLARSIHPQIEEYQIETICNSLTPNYLKALPTSSYKTPFFSTFTHVTMKFSIYPRSTLKPFYPTWIRTYDHNHKILIAYCKTKLIYTITSPLRSQHSHSLPNLQTTIQHMLTQWHLQSNIE